MQTDPVTIAMVALGGYGNPYLAELFNGAAAHNARLVAGIDPQPAGCQWLASFQEQAVPIYPSLEEFFARHRADLVVIASPIHLHLPFVQQALAHGANVLCEKPITPTVQEAWQMAAAQQAAGKFVGIGYQWSYAPAIQALKQDVQAGVLGQPRRLRTKVYWPRGERYYQRNTWAAKRQAANGTWILDSPAHNATAHFLHNCFYILGATRETSAWPAQVQAELYRANPIENFDTGALRCQTTDGVDILFYTTHAVARTVGPILSYEFENAEVTYAGEGQSLVARFRDGRRKDYGKPDGGQIANKLWQAVDAVRSGQPLACGIEAAIPEVLCTNGAQESMWQITEFPQQLRQVQVKAETGERLTWVTGLQPAFDDCFARGVLPSELGGLDWARPGQLIDLRQYRQFPSRLSGWDDRPR